MKQQREFQSSSTYLTKSEPHAGGISITFIVQAADNARKTLQELHDEVSCLHLCELMVLSIELFLHYAVAICKDSAIVGHLPQKDARCFSIF